MQLPDEKFVFNRRGKDAPACPGMLGLFGGHIESGESPKEAAKRELGEETSIPVDELKLSILGEFRMHEYGNKHFHVFLAQIPNPNFEVYEGTGAEVYNLKDALNRTDLTDSTMHTLKNFMKDK